MFAFLLNLFEYIPSYIHQSNLSTLKDIFLTRLMPESFFKGKFFPTFQKRISQYVNQKNIVFVPKSISPKVPRIGPP
jgi:hypothetical protein